MFGGERLDVCPKNGRFLDTWNNSYWDMDQKSWIAGRVIYNDSCLYYRCKYGILLRRSAGVLALTA